MQIAKILLFNNGVFNSWVYTFFELGALFKLCTTYKCLQQIGEVNFFTYQNMCDLITTQ